MVRSLSNRLGRSTMVVMGVDIIEEAADALCAGGFGVSGSQELRGFLFGGWASIVFGADIGAPEIVKIVNTVRSLLLFLRGRGRLIIVGWPVVQLWPLARRVLDVPGFERQCET